MINFINEFISYETKGYTILTPVRNISFDVWIDDHKKRKKVSFDILNRLNFHSIAKKCLLEKTVSKCDDQ